MIRRVPIEQTCAVYWTELLPLLAERGRADLAAAIRERLEEMRRFGRWAHDEGWKGRLRRVDRRIFGGNMLKARQRLFPGRFDS